MSRIDELYEKYWRRLKRMLRGRPDDDDIAQETLIAAWRRLEKGAAIDEEWAYLATAARNNANKRHTRAAVPRHGGGRVAALEDDHDAPDKRRNAEDELIGQDEVQRFRAAFDAVMHEELSADTRECVVLRRRGLSTQEIAKKLGLTDQAVRSRLSRANAVFRERLGRPPDVPWLEILGDDE